MDKHEKIKVSQYRKNLKIKAFNADALRSIVNSKNITSSSQCQLPIMIRSICNEYKAWSSTKYSARCRNFPTSWVNCKPIDKLRYQHTCYWSFRNYATKFHGIPFLHESAKCKLWNTLYHWLIRRYMVSKRN